MSRQSCLQESTNPLSGHVRGISLRAHVNARREIEVLMSYPRKNPKTILGAIVLMISIAALAAWQFYKYATFTDGRGILNIEGGTSHLVWAITMALFACAIGFVVFSVFLRHDSDDDLHITSPSHKAHFPGNDGT